MQKTLKKALAGRFFFDIRHDDACDSVARVE
jgi:hypothetical protein